MPWADGTYCGFGMVGTFKYNNVYLDLELRKVD